jgi:hypothetical protein
MNIQINHIRRALNRVRSEASVYDGAGKMRFAVRRLRRMIGRIGRHSDSINPQQRMATAAARTRGLFSNAGGAAGFTIERWALLAFALAAIAVAGLLVTRVLLPVAVLAQPEGDQLDTGPIERALNVLYDRSGPVAVTSNAIEICAALAAVASLSICVAIRHHLTGRGRTIRSRVLTARSLSIGVLIVLLLLYAIGLLQILNG